MKRLGHIWYKVISKENLRLALHNAARGKTSRSSVMRVLENEEYYIDKLHTMLATGTFTTSKYSIRTIYEPKQRDIYCLPFFPDRIVHHAIMNVLEESWDKSLIYDTYSCRKGKGQHRGSTRCMSFVHKYGYVLKCDISKFYPSVDHEVLKKILRRKIKDIYLLKLLDDIIDSANYCGTTPVGKNVPIGNLLSQWFGNLYLNELDRYIKNELKCKAYIRYCDDFVLFADDKQMLHQWRDKIRVFIETKLKLKFSKCAIYPTTQGVDFLGYRHFNGYLLLRKRTARKWRSFFNRLFLPPTRKVVSQIASFLGIVQWANCFNFKRSLGVCCA